MIIGITGNAQAGKDTTAEYLKKLHGFERIGMADPMKRFCKEVFDFSDEQLWGSEREKHDPRYVRWDENKKQTHLTPRYALQTLGTEWGRNCYDSVWVNYAIRMAQKILSGGGYYRADLGYVRVVGDDQKPPVGVVFSDLRFKNEFDAVKKAGGLMCRIYRPGKEGKVGIVGHASEEEQKTIPDSDF